LAYPAVFAPACDAGRAHDARRTIANHEPALDAPQGVRVLLADLMHFCRMYQLDFEEESRKARALFQHQLVGV
jgi:hypothetical protein